MKHHLPLIPASFRRLAAVVSSLILAPFAHATNNPWFDDFVAYDNAYGNRFTADTDAAFLGWQESYMLRAYLNLYEASHDTAWLTKFTDHFDTVMGTATDSDGDGYDDWTTARYSPNLIANDGFEVAAAGDATLPANWSRSGSTSSTAYRTNAAGEYVPGNACSTVTWGAKLVTAGTTLQRLYQDITSYIPGHRYELTIRGRNGGAVQGRAFVYDRTTGTTLGNVWITTSSWKSYSVQFTMPATAGHDIELWLSHAATTGSGDTTFFDLARVAPYFSYHVIDGMIGIPAARFVRLVNQHPTTLAAFQTDADTYQDFLEDHVIAKWEDSSGFYGDTWVDLPGGTEGYYVEPANYDTFSANASFSPLPHNQYMALLEVQNILYDVNGNAAYRAKADRGATFFANLLTFQGTAYFWYYGTHAGSKIEDASHANVDMEFINSLYQSGSVFDGADMEAFTDTQTEYLWNGSITAPEQNNHINGTQGSYCGNYLFSRDLYGWIPYAQFDPLVWYIGAAQYSAVAAGSHSEAAALSEIIKWDPVKLVNQGFELANSADATLPARWERFQSTSSTAYRDSAHAHGGTYGATLVSNGTQWQKLKQPWTDYTASASYTITFDAKVDTSGANGRVWIYNETTSSNVAAWTISSTTWQTYSYTFTAPSTATDDVAIMLGHADYTVTGGEAHFDNVSIKRTGDAW